MIKRIPILKISKFICIIFLMQIVILLILCTYNTIGSAPLSVNYKIRAKILDFKGEQYLEHMNAYNAEVIEVKIIWAEKWETEYSNEILLNNIFLVRFLDEKENLKEFEEGDYISADMREFSDGIYNITNVEKITNPNIYYGLIIGILCIFGGAFLLINYKYKKKNIEK